MATTTTTTTTTDPPLPPRVLGLVAAAEALEASGRPVTPRALAAATGLAVAAIYPMAGRARRAGRWPWWHHPKSRGRYTDADVLKAANVVAARGDAATLAALRGELATALGLDPPPSLSLLSDARRRWRARGRWPWPSYGHKGDGPRAPSPAERANRERYLAVFREHVGLYGGVRLTLAATELGRSKNSAKRMLRRLRAMGYRLPGAKPGARPGSETPGVARRLEAARAAKRAAPAPTPPDRRRARTNIEPVPTYRVATGG